MLNKLDTILFNTINLGVLGFLLYGGVVYAPESDATLLLVFISFIVIIWYMLYIFDKLNDRRIMKKINKYYQ